MDGYMASIKRKATLVVEFAVTVVGLGILNAIAVAPILAYISGESDYFKIQPIRSSHPAFRGSERVCNEIIPVIPAAHFCVAS